MMSQYDLDILQDTITEIREAEREAAERAANPSTRFTQPSKKSRFSL